MKRCKLICKVMAAVLTLVAIPAVGVMAADTYTVNKGGCYVKNGTQLTPYEEKTYSSEEEATYTATIVGATSKEENEALVGFCLDGKFEEGVLNEDGSRSYTFPKGTTGEHVIYGIRKDKTYTVNVLLIKNGTQVDPVGKRTYLASEEATYVATSAWEGDSNEDVAGFAVDGKFQPGVLNEDGSRSYTFPKGTTGSHEIYGVMKGERIDYEDVKESDWFFDAAYYVKGKGYMTGLDSYIFGPSESLARAQFIVILNRMEGKPKPVAFDGSHWTDITEDWYKDAVYWGIQNKIMTGYSDSDCWGTADVLTREQLATVMYRYAEYKGYDVKKRADLESFEDASSVSGFAKEAVEWAVAEGIITGKDNGTKLDPQGETARAQCAAIIQRFVENYEEK